MVASNLDRNYQKRNLPQSQHDWLYSWERPLVKLWERMVGNVIDKKSQMVLIRILGGVIMLAMLEHFVLMVVGKPMSDDFTKTLATVALGALTALLIPRHAEPADPPLKIVGTTERNQKAE